MIYVVVRESEVVLADQLERFERVRHLGTPSRILLEAAHANHVAVIHDPVTANGRLELRYYLHEQAVSETLHRYTRARGKVAAMLLDFLKMDKATRRGLWGSGNSMPYSRSPHPQTPPILANLDKRFGQIGRTQHIPRSARLRITTIN